MTYAEAMMPPGFPVRGLTLVPLTLGHLLLLERVESPFIARSRSTHPIFSTGHTALALWICSRDWRSAMARLGKWSVRVRLAWMGSAVAQAPAWYAQQVLDYLAYHRQSPSRRSLREGSGKTLPPIGAPMSAAVKVAIMSELGIPEEEALDRPLLACLFDLAVCAERDGGVQIVPDPTPEELAQQRDADADLIAAARRVAAENKARLEGAPRG